MKTNKLLLLIIVLITIPVISKAENCQIPMEKLDSSNIALCENKTVIITTKTSELGLQHPTGIHNSYDFITNKLKKEHENYILFDNIEIVATYKEPFNCSDQIELEGTVNIVDLGGTEGKNSYKNVWIKTKNYNCID